jgi:hypothetical protein
MTLIVSTLPPPPLAWLGAGGRSIGTPRAKIAKAFRQTVLRNIVKPPRVK